MLLLYKYLDEMFFWLNMKAILEWRAWIQLIVQKMKRRRT